MPFYVFPFRPIASRDTHTSHMRRSIMTRLLLRGGLPSAPAPRLPARCVASSSPSSSSRPTTSALPEWRTTTFGGQDRIGTDGALVQDDDGPTHRLTTPGGGLVSCWEKCLEKLEEVQACRERAWLAPRPRLFLSLSLSAPPIDDRPRPRHIPRNFTARTPRHPGSCLRLRYRGRRVRRPARPAPLAGGPGRPGRVCRVRLPPGRPHGSWRQHGVGRARLPVPGRVSVILLAQCAPHLQPTPLPPPPPTLSHKKGRSPRSHRPTPIIAIPFFSPFFHHTARTRPGLSR